MDWTRKVPGDEIRNRRRRFDVDLLYGLPEVSGGGLKIVVSRTLGGIPGVLLILLVLLLSMGLLPGLLSPEPEALNWLFFPGVLITLSIAANRPRNSRFRFSSRQQLILGVVLSTVAILLLPMLSAGHHALFLAGVWLILIWTYTLPTMIPGVPLAVTWGLALLSLVVGWWLQRLGGTSHFVALLLIIFTHLIGMKNITHRDQSTARLLAVIRSLYRKATTDEVTGVLNRLRFSELAEREISRANRYGRPVTLLLIDIDYFKSIYDRHGHLEGESVLRTLAECLRGNVRDADIVGRFDDEEFAVVLSGYTPSAAGEVAKRVLSCFRAQTASSLGVGIRFGISIGIAGIFHPRPTLHLSLEELIRLADKALHCPNSEDCDKDRFSDTCSYSMSSREKL